MTERALATPRAGIRPCENHRSASSRPAKPVGARTARDASRVVRLVAQWIVLAGLAVGLASCRNLVRRPAVTPSAGPRPATAPAIGAAHGVELFLESNEPGAEVLELPQSLVHIPVRAQPVLSSSDVTSVEVVGSEMGKALQVRFTPSAAQELQRVSAAAGRRRLVLAINGVPLGALRLSGPITEGQIAVFLEVPDVYLPRLLTNLRAEGVPVAGGIP